MAININTLKKQLFFSEDVIYHTTSFRKQLLEQIAAVG